jgi:tetratricopeptide (TPR) repeat protein
LMEHRSHQRIALLIILCTCAAPRSLAERGFVFVEVQDAQGHPVRGIELKIGVLGAPSTTGNDGAAKLSLSAETVEGELVSLILVHSPSGTDYVLNSPWDGRIPVPAFEDKPENFVEVVVVKRGDRAVLENGSVLASLAAAINKANAPRSVKSQDAPLDPKASLEAVARQYGLTADDIDHAIRDWGAKTTDPYDAGMAALYERNYPKAVANLQDSLTKREVELAAAQGTEQAQRRVAGAAFFLATALYHQGRYRESAQAAEKCLSLRSDDPRVLTAAGASFEAAGEFGKAEPLLRKALAIDEKTLGSNTLGVANDLNSVGHLLVDKGDYVGAEKLFRRAMAINENALGPGSTVVADSLVDLGNISMIRGAYSEAQSLFRRALKIREDAFGPDDPTVTVTLASLGSLLDVMGDFTSAEPLLQRALAIDEKALGPDHPTVAIHLTNLATLLAHRGDIVAAEPLYRRALGIREKALGPDHPAVAQSLGNLGALVEDKGDYAEAGPLLRRALAIDEKALGPDHPTVATDLYHLANLLTHTGAFGEAEPLYQRALAIDEKALGPDHLALVDGFAGLGTLLADKGDYARAEPLMRRALAIDETVLGSNHPRVSIELALLGHLLATKGAVAEAEPLLRRSLEIRENVLGPDTIPVAEGMVELGNLLERKRATCPRLSRCIAEHWRFEKRLWDQTTPAWRRVWQA